MIIILFKLNLIKGNIIIHNNSLSTIIYKNKNSSQIII